MDVFLVAPRPGEDPAPRMVCQIRGGTAEARQRLLDVFRQGDPHLIRMPSLPDRLRANMSIPPSTMSPQMRSLLAFAAANRLGMVWSCVENGVAFVRLLVDDDQDLSTELDAHLRSAGFEAQVATEEADPDDVRVRLREVASTLEQLRQARDGPAQGF